MSYQIVNTPRAQKGIDKHIKSGNKIVIAKLLSLLEELKEHPREGNGTPERLKHQTADVWSRRIDRKHRLTYEIRENELIVISLSAFGHYDDK